MLVSLIFKAAFNLSGLVLLASTTDAAGNDEKMIVAAAEALKLRRCKVNEFEVVESRVNGIDQGAQSFVEIVREASQQSQSSSTTRFIRKNYFSGHEFRREAIALLRLQHRNLVMAPVCFEARPIRLIMELAEGADLGFRAFFTSEKYGEAELQQWTAGIVSTLLKVHSHSILHNDLGPRNIIALANNTIRFIDFGLSGLFNQPTIMMRHPLKAAPEVLFGPQEAIAQPSMDWWPLGITLYRLHARFYHCRRANSCVADILDFYPFKHVQRHRNGTVTYISRTTPTEFSPEFRDLLKLLLANNPKDRDFSTNPKRRLRLLNHPYFRGIDWSADPDLTILL